MQEIKTVIAPREQVFAIDILGNPMRRIADTDNWEVAVWPSDIPIATGAQEVYEYVRSFRLLAQHGALSFRRLLSQPVDAKFAISALRSTYPFRDGIDYWYMYKDHVIANWPKDADKREYHGLENESPGTEWMNHNYQIDDLISSLVDMASIRVVNFKGLINSDIDLSIEAKIALILTTNSFKHEIEGWQEFRQQTLANWPTDEHLDDKLIIEKMI